jgi:hypothetical protein
MAQLTEQDKTLCFFIISFNPSEYDIDVKIYRTAQLTMYVSRFLNQKTNICVGVANVLWVAFSIPSAYYHL